MYSLSLVFKKGGFGGVLGVIFALFFWLFFFLFKKAALDEVSKSVNKII